MGDWIKIKLEELAIKMQSGGTPKSDNSSYYNGDIPFVTIEDMTSTKKYLTVTKKNITQDGLQSSSAWLVPENTLLYSIYATLGVPRINKMEVATNQAILNIIPNLNKVDLEFLYYLLDFKRGSILEHSAHTTQSNLNAKIVKNLEFVIPEAIEEQKEIAGVLRSIDKSITLSSQLIEKYNRIKDGLLQELLTKGIDDKGNIRSELTHEFKESPIGIIPKEWGVLPSSQLTKEIKVGIVVKPSQYYVEDGIPMLRSFNVKETGIELTNLVYMSREDNARNSKSILRTGDIVSVRTGNPGVSAIVTEKLDGINCIDLVITKPDLNKMIPEFLVTWINSKGGKSQILKYQGGIAQQHFNVGDMKELLVPKMSIEEQIRIVESMKSIRARIKEEQIRNDKFKRIKKGLMQDLLTGKIHVNELSKKGVAL